jgi:hypothetical protein
MKKPTRTTRLLEDYKTKEKTKGETNLIDPQIYRDVRSSVAEKLGIRPGSTVHSQSISTAIYIRGLEQTKTRTAIFSSEQQHSRVNINRDPER